MAKKGEKEVWGEKKKRLLILFFFMINPPHLGVNVADACSGGDFSRIKLLLQR